MEEVRRSGADRRKRIIRVEVERRSGVDRRAVNRDSRKIIEYMKKIPIFNGLEDSDYKSILHICSKRLIPADHYLCRAGDESHALYILIRGKLRVETGSGTLLAYIDTLGLVGEMGVFTDTPRSASVLAVDDSMVIRISKVELFELFKNNCPLGSRIFLNVIRDLALKLREDNEVIEELRKRRSGIF